ncbi:DUF6182 family protein [Actinophytocola sp. KF-1]
MSLTQDVLRDRVADRIRVSRPDCSRDLSTYARLLSVQREAEDDAGPVAVSVLARYEPAAWIRGTCAFAMGLTGARVTAWRRAFTRTVFLAGNPANLVGRFDFAHVADDGSAAWTAPAAQAATGTLRRLLRLFEGAAELPARDELPVRLPGHGADPVRRALYLTTAGMTVADSLVHLNHLLVEAVLDGLLRPGDELLVRQVPRLVGVGERFDALRIGPDADGADRLRAFAGLTGAVRHD